MLKGLCGIPSPSLASLLPPCSAFPKRTFSLSRPAVKRSIFFGFSPLHRKSSCFRLHPVSMSTLLEKLGFGTRATGDTTSVSQGPDADVPSAGELFAQFAAGCFWGVELAFQRTPGVTKTEVGYSQGSMHDPSYTDVCSGATKHAEVVRLQYDPKLCSYEELLSVFWDSHDPTTHNRQGNDVGTQYRSGIYFYTPEQEKAAFESKEMRANLLKKAMATEILHARKFYRADEYHQQYLEKGGRFGSKQSAEKGCSDSIRCYG